ncbi:Inner membrane protein YrbG [Aeoliella mucimassa]|uniref:Inner membrane protein YrbG n=1 Tax=Aeoliella mucimassa TaxID=2527972 RepID=A0A518AL13_9BACT|nr:Inner membrane protein YrbG [Aeoliella mucimassa]
MIAGGELLVRGASNLAAAAKVSPLIIGLTVVAFGTSAPELAVSIQSCYEGKTDLAVGNAVGSNISNLLFILGVSAIAAPLAVSLRLFRLDIPAMIVAALMLLGFGWDGKLDRVEGAVCFLTLVCYFIFTVRQGRRESAIAAAESQIAVQEITYDPKKSTAKDTILDVVKLLIGLALLVKGADWLVKACVSLAQGFGVSELVIGLTVVAIGTSLPELVTSLMASLRGERDLAVGNVVGSNILNILLVLGLSSVVAPDGINVDRQSLAFDIPVLIAMSVAAIPVFFSGMVISRIEGIAMLLYYLSYLGYLVRHASRPAGTVTPAMETVLFLAPLVPLVLTVIVVSRWKSKSTS